MLMRLQTILEVCVYYFQAMCWMFVESDVISGITPTGPVERGEVAMFSRCLLRFVLHRSDLTCEIWGIIIIIISKDKKKWNRRFPFN